MNLDDLDFIQQLDPQGMQAEIDHLPDQLQAAWELGQRQPGEGLTPAQGFSRVVISGMGGSAIGADLLSAYIASTCKIPVIVHRDYGLPAWARGPKTLVIASSHSGDTEETLDSFEAALNSKCHLMAMTTGGELARRAAEKKIPLWQFEHHGQPRAAVGFSFGLLLAAFARLGLIDPPEKMTTQVSAAVTEMKKQQETLRVDVPVVKNPAKRLAGQLVGRWVNVFGSGLMVPVARRWKTQINELGKAGAGFEFLPEADHNTLAGLEHPAETLSRIAALFLTSPSDLPRNRLRADLTRHAFMLEGITTDHYNAQGETPLAQLWTALHFGDYMAFFLAMACRTNPTPVEVLEKFKAAMKAAKQSLPDQ